MQNNNSASGNWFSLSSILLTIFIVLKLVGVIDWSWWWVLSPLWISLIGFVVLDVVCLLLLKWFDTDKDE